MNVLIAHSRPLVRAGLRALLLAHDPNAEIVEARCYDELRRGAEAKTKFDVVLLDIDLPGTERYEGLRKIAADLASVPVVVVAGSESEIDISMALDHGASGYIPESSDGDLFINALRLVASGNMYVPPAIFRSKRASDGSPRRNGATGHDGLASLTPRQKEVLALIAQGASNKEMADRLGIAEGTIRIHVAAILKGLKLRNRTQAALVAVQNKWVDNQGHILGRV